MSESMEITNKEEVLAQMKKNSTQQKEITSSQTNVCLVDEQTKRRWLTPSIIPQN